MNAELISLMVLALAAMMAIFTILHSNAASPVITFARPVLTQSLAIHVLIQHPQEMHRCSVPVQTNFLKME
jgi:hypothetical protein